MYKYRLFSPQDSDAVRELVRVAFPNFLGGTFWDWKHFNNPWFDPSIVAIAENDSEIVGCSHWLQRDLKIGRNLVVGSLLTCDLSVKPDQRGRGIARELLLQRRTREIFRKRGIVVNYDFADPKLAKKLYTPLLGYTRVGLAVRRFVKVLNWKPLVEFVSREETAEVLLKRFPKLRDLDLSICLKSKSAPSLTLCFKNGEIGASENKPSNVHIVVEADLSELIAVFGAKHVRTWLLKALFERKIKLKGKPSKLYQVYRNFSLLKTVLRVISVPESVFFSRAQTPKYHLRNFEDGDEVGIVRLFDRAYASYGGFVPRDSKYWLWCCLQRPDVEREGVFVVVNENNNGVVGYAVAGKSGNVWELCYDPAYDVEKIVGMLLGETTRYLESIGAASVTFNAVKEDLALLKVCNKFGFEALGSPKMYLSILDTRGIVALLADSKREELVRYFDESILVKLKGVPKWIKDTLFIRIDRNGVYVDENVHPYTILVKTDFTTFSSILAGILTPSAAVAQSKLDVEPARKTSTAVKLLSYLRLDAKWFFPMSDYG
jgi:GNAT superfamily N-acetyltransferase